MKKRCLAGLLSAMMVFGLLAGCGSSGTEEKTEGGSTTKEEAGDKDQITVACTWQDLANEYIMQLAEVAEAYCEEKGYQYVSADGQGDADNQVSQVENFITQGVDAIVLNPYDKDGCIPCAQKAAEAGIPIVVVCTQLSDLSSATAFVGSNDVEAGEIEMQMVADAIDGKGDIAVILGPTGISAQADRSQGIQNILDKYPDINVIYEESANWDRAEAMTLMENWLQTGKTINAVVAQNDEMAIGAYNAIAAAGKQKDIPVVGIDAIADALKSVEEGGLLCTVFQNAKAQSETAIDVAVQAAKGEKVDDWYDVPFELVTSDNVGDYK